MAALGLLRPVMLSNAVVTKKWTEWSSVTGMRNQDALSSLLTGLYQIRGEMDVDFRTEEKKNPQWGNRLTRELVTAAFGAAQWKKAHPSVRSMTDRPEFCRYHYHEALDLMNQYIESNLKETGLNRPGFRGGPLG